MAETENAAPRSRGGWPVTLLAATMLAVSAPISNIFMGERDIFPPAVDAVLHAMRCQSAAYEGEDVYQVAVDMAGGRYAIVQTTVAETNGQIYLRPGSVVAEGWGEAPCGRSIQLATLFEKAAGDGEICVDFTNLEGTPTASREEIGGIYRFYATRRRECVLGDLKTPSRASVADQS